MFRQGDRERALGQPISPLMDRTKGGVTKSQTGFFNVVALPMYTVGRISYPGSSYQKCRWDVGCPCIHAIPPPPPLPPSPDAKIMQIMQAFGQTFPAASQVMANLNLNFVHWTASEEAAAPAAASPSL